MTEKRILTDSFLRSVQPTGQRISIWDAGNPGFGVRVGTAGDISFQYLYRFEGRSRRYTLGSFPLMTLHAAREAYHRAAITLTKGIDPALQQAQRRRIEKEAMTVEGLCSAFIERYAKSTKRTWREDERQLRRDVIPILGKKRAKEVTRKEIIALIDAKVDSGAPIAANRLLALLSKLFSWAVERDEVAVSPCKGIRKPAKERSRERVLQHPEVFPLWHALDQDGRIGMHACTRRALQVMLLTGQRKGEVLRMRWNELEHTAHGWVWTIPSSNAKNGQAHRVPIVSEVIDLLTGLRKSSPKVDESPWCFASPKDPGKHISLHAPDHAIRDEAQRPESPLHQLTRFTPHDFRRTVATGLSVLGYPRLIVQKVLNHSDKSVTSAYDRYNYDKEKREALTRWAEMLIAATWPVGKEYDEERNEWVPVWDYSEEWDRMAF